MISLTDLPYQVFLVPCERNDTRYLALRNDDPDGEELVLFVADTHTGVAKAVESMVDTGVVLRRESATALVHVLLDAAMNLGEDADEGGPWVDPESNGHGG